MFHDDFSLFLSPVLKDLSNRSSIDVLDCGCGDAYLLSNQLRRLPVFSFTGYDMSNQALDAARNNLAKLECEIVLKQGPMEESIQSEEKEFDIIYSSFAIHHLQDADKRKLLDHFYAKLKKNGVLILIDLLRNQSLSRGDYLEEYIQYIAKEWDEIEAIDKELVYEHMRNYDFPSTRNDFKNWIADSGFIVQNHFDADSRNTLFIAQK